MVMTRSTGSRGTRYVFDDDETWSCNKVGEVRREWVVAGRRASRAATVAEFEALWEKSVDIEVRR